jgi:hypothetical protein
LAKNGGGAVAVHHTDTSDASWDGGQTERRLADDDVRAFRSVYAYVDPERPERKTGAKFPHHEVRSDGDAGPANVKACVSGIGVLNGGRGGADINKTDRKAIYEHLAAHMKDAGREPPDLED